MHIVLFAQSSSIWTYIFTAVWKSEGVSIKSVCVFYPHCRSPNAVTSLLWNVHYKIAENFNGVYYPISQTRQDQGTYTTTQHVTLLQISFFNRKGSYIPLKHWSFIKQMVVKSPSVDLAWQADSYSWEELFWHGGADQNFFIINCFHVGAFRVSSESCTGWARGNLCSGRRWTLSRCCAQTSTAPPSQARVLSCSPSATPCEEETTQNEGHNTTRWYW